VMVPHAPIVRQRAAGAGDGERGDEIAAGERAARNRQNGRLVKAGLVAEPRPTN
jgi:hypothetical protein